MATGDATMDSFTSGKQYYSPDMSLGIFLRLSIQICGYSLGDYCLKNEKIQLSVIFCIQSTESLVSVYIRP